MSERARVSSVEAIEAFRTSLIVYLDRVRPLVEESASDLRRTRQWIETEQRQRWEREHRRRAIALEQARQALLSARISSFRGAIASEQLAVHRAQQAMEEADDKLRLLRKWSRDFEPRTRPLARPVEMLETVLIQDMGRAVTFLTEILRLLNAYAETRPALPSAPAPTDSAAEPVPAAPAPAGSDPAANPS